MTNEVAMNPGNRFYAWPVAGMINTEGLVQQI
jgi:hypothetical protein